MSSAPLRGRVLRWVPGRIPLALHAPGKAVEGLARTPRLSEAGFSDAQAIAGAIAEYAHRLQAISKWRRIIFEGSNFPDKNTAPKNGITRVRRNEWLAWRNTVICAKAYTLAILQLITAPSSSKENVAVAVRYRISAMH